MTTVPLNSYAPVTLDAGGNGTAKIGPASLRETWSVAVVHVKTNQAPTAIINEAQCFVYAGPDTSDQYFVDSTSSGSTGDSTDSAAACPLQVSEYVWAVWKGGDAGAQATVRVTGTRELA